MTVSRVLVTAITFLVLATGAWFGVLWCRSFDSYRKVQADLHDGLLSVRQMDAGTTAFAETARTSWKESSAVVDGPHSEACREVGLVPSVQSVADLYTRRMPPFSWMSPQRNKQALVFAMAQMVLMPISVDGAVHVSNDGRRALVRIHEDAVLLYADESAGLRESLYVAKPLTE